MSEGRGSSRIEHLYQRYGEGGQNQILERKVPTDEIAAAFETTVAAVSDGRGRGPFHPSGTRAALFDLYEERQAASAAIRDTQHLQALLWSPPRWQVEDRPDLEFMFVAREISPGSAVQGNKRAWIIDKDCRVSADLLLMNTTDRTPIVAEFKRGGDQNADYALVQALAAAAQLSPHYQRARLRTEYSEHFGKEIPELLDVFVIVADPPPRGTRPKLFDRALAHAAELTSSERLKQWVRNIVFLEAKPKDGGLTFRVLDKPSS